MQLWALNSAWWNPEVGPVLQKAYKLMREINVPEWAIFKKNTQQHGSQESCEISKVTLCV